MKKAPGNPYVSFQAHGTLFFLRRPFREAMFFPSGDLPGLQCVGMLERTMLSLINLCNGVSWKSNMKHVIKYDVFLDILLMVSIYAIKCEFVFNEHTN